MNHLPENEQKWMERTNTLLEVVTYLIIAIGLDAGIWRSI